MFFRKGRLKTLTVTVLVAGTLAVIGLLAVRGYFLDSHGEPGRTYRFQVSQGQTLKQVSRNLEAIGLVASASRFEWAGRLFFRDVVVKAGDYGVPAPVSTERLFALLDKGRDRSIRVTIPEGFNAREIFEVLKGSAILNGKDYDEAERRLVSTFAADGWGNIETLEGFLFPDTYFFSVRESEVSILKKMVENFFGKMPADFPNRARTFGVTPYEALILASIVEKETGASRERGLIASVLHNRIRVGMPLQSDPTVIYGIKDFDGNLRKVHLRAPTPYNTYVIPRLPPTPIANPGVDSLLAVIHPETTQYLYFVAKGDGTSHFSKTLREHNGAIRKYQLNRSSDYRSTPN